VLVNTFTGSKAATAFRGGKEKGGLLLAMSLRSSIYFKEKKGGK